MKDVGLKYPANLIKSDIVAVILIVIRSDFLATYSLLALPLVIVGCVHGSLVVSDCSLLPAALCYSIKFPLLNRKPTLLRM